ncbi:hypothetical protein QE152_g9682 [Popillia japonica]|uniref:Uncharacterized protein n=1 Tax=Popillia japonica TaxID=7064 RepID=A0AAW1LXR9_POPJA
MDPSVFYGKSSNTKNFHMFTRLPPNNPEDSDDPDLSESDDDLNEEGVILAKESDSFFEEDAEELKNLPFPIPESDVEEYNNQSDWDTEDELPLAKFSDKSNKKEE